MMATRISARSRAHFSLLHFIAGIILAALFGALVTPDAQAASSPVPYVDLVSPVSINPGSTNVTLTISGTGFVGTSVVNWNGTPLVTTFVSAQRLTAAVPDGLVAAVGLGSVTVVTPRPGGGPSNITYVPVAAFETATNFPVTPNSSPATGAGPQGIVTADFNGDGKIDLAIANNVAGTVTVLLGNGDGTFTAAPTVTAGAGADWIAVGDFNEDGKLDMAVANLTSTGLAGVTILLGNGDGTFTAAGTPNTGSGPISIITADFNHDGHLDLAISNSSDGTVTLLLGNGTGAFSFGSTSAVGSAPQVLVAGDFNEDGILDLAVPNLNDNTVSILLGNGDGTFQPQTTVAVGGTGAPIGLIAADYNQDGHVDLAAVNASDVAILLGSGTGAFTLHASPTTGSNDLISGVAGDYNGDGKLDLVVSDRNGGQAFLLPGIGDGTFGPAVTFTTASGAYGVATADFNGDGALDLAITNTGANNVSIFLQQLPVTLSPTSLTFPDQLLNTPSAPQNVTLTNHTGGALTFTSIGFTGADAGDYSQTNTCGAAIANTTSCTISVTFTPTALGTRVATLQVADDASNSPQTLAVSGVGATAPAITSANNTIFIENTAGTFTVTTTGTPTPALSETGALPNFVTFTDNADGTAALAGTPSLGTAGSYPLIITAHSAFGADATQAFTLNVVAPPIIAKTFGAATIPVNGTTTLSFTITNPAANTIALGGVSFTDTLPAGLVVANPNGLTGTCGGGTITAVAGSSTVSLATATLAPTTSCTFAVNVTGTTSGVKNNSVTVDSTTAGTGNTSNASITVVNAPAITKTFGAATTAVGGSTSLTFTITNPAGNTIALAGVGFTDTLPAGMVVSTPNGLTGTCGGGTITGVAGSGTVSLANATLAPNTTCTFAVNVTPTTAGVKNNSVQVTSTTAGAGNTSNASLTAAGPPVLTKAFGAASIATGGSTSLTFTVQNNNATTQLTGVGFTDTLPAGLVVATPNGLAGTCGGGVITATQATNLVSLTGATLAQSATCTFSVNVTGIAAGVQNNTTGAVTSTEGGTGGTASASVSVIGPPSIAKVFTPATVGVGTTSSLSFTITNPAANTVALTGVAFTDTLPTGLTVATGVVATCGGTLTTTAPTTIALTAATVAANGTCAFNVTVTGAVLGQYTNTTGAVSSTNGGTGNTATANLTVAGPPTIAKAFSAASVPLNGSSTLTFTITNPNTTVALTGLAFTDTLPVGLQVAATPAVTNSCGGIVTAGAGSGTVTLAAGTRPANGTCTVTVSVTGTTAGVKNNTVQITSTEGGTGNTANASITVATPPVLTKAFGAASIATGGSTSLTFTVQNNNATTQLTGVGFTDTLPAGLVVATPNGLAGTCSGVITATQATNLVSLTGATLAQSATCTFSVNVTGTAAGVQNNTTGAVTSTEGGTGGTASASVSVIGAPTIAKAFNPTGIAVGGTTSLGFTITNPVANAVALTGVAFTDTLPTGLTVATGVATICGGTLTTTAPTTIALTGATVAANGTCAFNVTVTGAVAGAYTNTTGAVSSTNGGTGNTATANLTVAAPPTINKTFSAAAVPLNGSTTLTFAITNPNRTLALTGLAFTDTLPAGLQVAATPAVTNSCGGTVTATAGSGTVTLAAGTRPASGTCTVTVSVTATTAGVKNNSVQITSTEAGAGNTSNASITVATPPVLTKAFGAASIGMGGSTSLTFTVQNNNATTQLTGVGFTDTLPSGLVVATPNGLTGTCGGGTITATQATNLVSLTGATLAPNALCTFSVNVTGIAGGVQNNTTGAVTSTEGGTGATASASVSVVGAPTIAKVFNPTGIGVGATTSLGFTITNPTSNTVALTGVAFTDTLPTGLTVATGVATVCGGTLTTTAPTAISLTGATVAANGTCAFNVTVTGAVAGQYTNTTGTVSSTNGGTGGTATANLTVAAPPTVSKAFAAANIALNGSTTLTFTLTNPNPTINLTGIGFTDTLPAGLVVATPPAITGSCAGGTTNAVPGSGTITLSTTPLAGNATCFFSVNVTGTAAGPQANTTGPITSTQSGPGAVSNTATVTVLSAPAIAKAFGAATIPIGGSTSLTFTITNPNAGAALAGVAFTDTLPSGLTVATPNGLTGTCGAGTVTATAGTATISLAGGTVPASGNCNFSVNVTGTAGGAQVNTTAAVTSTNAGTGNTATATVTVIVPDLTITKTHAGSFTQSQNGAIYTITVTNSGAVPTSGAVTVTDTLPTGLTATAIAGAGWTCGLTPLSCTRSDALANGVSYPPITLTVNVAFNAAPSITNTATVSGGGESNTTNDTATDTTTVIQVVDLALAKSHVATFYQGQVGAVYTLTVSNPGGSASTGQVTVVDTLPVGFTATAMAGTGWTCTVNTLTCTRSDALAPAGSYPTITLTVTVDANAPASLTNSATLTGGGDSNPANNTATDVTTITPPPDFSITASPSTDTIRAGHTGSYTLTLTPINQPFPNAITFTATGLPNKSSFSTKPVSVTPGANPAMTEALIFTTAGDPFTGQNLPMTRGPLAVFLPASWLLLGLSFRKKWVQQKLQSRALLIFAALTCSVLAYGCASSAKNFAQLGTPPGTYTITITGTSGTIQHSTNVTLTVTP